VVMTATLDFLDRYLKDRGDGLERLQEHLAGEPLARCRRGRRFAL